MSSIDRYAVIGHPIAHSKSPSIHELFAQQTAQSMTYDAIDIAPADLANELKAFFNHGGCGLNVTVPHKEQIPALVDQLSSRAKLAGAVNTIAKLPNGELVGDNTDGEGLLRDMVVNLNANLEDARILILGAGGATRGIIPALLSAQPRVIKISNRTVTKATSLAEHFDTNGNVFGCGYDNIDNNAYDVIIHATSAGLSGELPPLPEGVIGAYSLCYDLSYAQQDTVFVAKAKQLGCESAYDGLGMLVEQAAAAFELWRGIRPKTTSVIESLRNA
ncbi:MAG: shikimate dehydrogenase [Gammaproteobacteria bacterium]|jgi:shikimate dehydrogenase|nr:shikimate dehydrogenase [Gammaproteobacteria bacterium]